MFNETLTPKSETNAACCSKNKNDLRIVRPQFNTKRDEDAFEVGVALPGVAKSDISVAFDQGVLSISAERRHPLASGETVLRREIDDIRFELKLRVADSLDASNISAKHVDGILTLRLGMREEAKPRSIEIN